MRFLNKPTDYSSESWFVAASKDSLEVHATDERETIICVSTGSRFNKEALEDAELTAMGPEMITALRAIIARINGVLDDPNLLKCGILSLNTKADILYICRSVVDKFDSRINQALKTCEQK